MRLLRSALGIAVAGGVLAGCATTATTPNTNLYDDAAPARVLTVLHALVPGGPIKPTSGIYVSVFYGDNVLGYSAANRLNKMPLCSVSGVSNVNGIAVDGKGDLLVPNGGSEYLTVYKGPTMCGKQIGLIADSYGQPADAAANDATSGPIVIANIRDDEGYKNGSISVCTRQGGCTVNLTNDSMYEAGGVAISNNGDCWVDAKPTSSRRRSLNLLQGMFRIGRSGERF